MYPSKAIELLDDLHKIPHTQLDPDYLDAIALGRNALAFLTRLRSDKHCSPSKRLPGESAPDDSLLPAKPFFIYKPY